ncbi:MAG: response regulator [Magnetococcus sp. WYHC-3]
MHPTLPSWKVLLADDEDGSRLLLSRILSHLGQSVSACADGLQAWSHIQETTFDLVLLDRRMPGLDGVELARRLRDLRADPVSWMRKVPWVAIFSVPSPAGQSADWEEGHAAGVDAWLTRPLLLDQVRQLLQVLAAQERSNGRLWTGAGWQESPSRTLTEPSPREACFFNPAPLERYLTDLGPERLRPVLAQALRTLEEAGPRLSQATPDQWMSLAHKLRGSCASSGLEALADLAARLESRAQAGDTAACIPLLEQLAPALSTGHDAVLRWQRDRLPGGAAPPGAA